MRLFVLGLLLVVFSPAAGQTTSSFQVGGSGLIGNYRAVGLSASGEIERSDSLSVINISPSYQWSEQSAYGSDKLNLYQNEFYMTATASKRIGRLKFITFTENESSYQRNIDIRSSVGVGLGGILVNARNFEVSASNAILPEYFLGSSSTKNNLTVRNSVRLKIVATVKKLEIKSVSLFQPAIQSSRGVVGADNLNMRSINTIAIRISEHYSIGIQIVSSYQGYPHYLDPSVKLAEHSGYIVLKRD